MLIIAQSAYESWSFPFPITCVLALAAFFYLRGWLRLRNAFPNAIPIWRLAVFMGGLFSLWIAIGSPLQNFDDALLSLHMVQHILLMGVAPPLILLGAPALPFLHGLPQFFVRGVLGPLLRWSPVQWLARIFTHPIFCWLAATVALIGWHTPRAFELALHSQFWHEVEHASFFITSILFWWPVVQPWPSVARWPRWAIPLYLFLGTIVNDIVSAFLALYDRVLYSSYASVPRPFNIAPLDDQAFAGAMMWVFGTFVYLVPAVAITMQILSPRSAQHQFQTREFQTRGAPSKDTVQPSNTQAVDFARAAERIEPQLRPGCLQLCYSRHPRSLRKHRY
jgi:putative membrane protein